MGKANGFTMVEVLVTTAITSVVILSLMGVFRIAQVTEYQHRCAVENAQSLRRAAVRVTNDVRVATQLDNPTDQELTLTMPAGQLTYQIADGEFRRGVTSPFPPLVRVDAGQSYVRKTGQMVSLHLVLAPPADARCGTKPLGPDSALHTNIALYSLP